MKKQKKTKKQNSRKPEPVKKTAPLNLDFDLEPPRSKSYFSDEAAVNQAKQSSEKRYTKNEIRKRQNKKRKLKNSVRNAIITFCVLLAISVIGIVLSLTMFFNITSINISGSGIYTAEQIEQVCGIRTGDNLFLTDSEKSRKLLTEALPYIYDVTFKKKLPATLNIEITDAVAAYAVANEDGTFTLLDDNLKVLENAAQENSVDTIMIKDVLLAASGAGHTVEFENPDALNCIKSIADALKAVGLSDISEISSADKNNNYILYKNRIVLELGDCSNLENKLYKCLAACEELENKNGEIKGRINISNGKQIYFTEN